MYAHTCIFFSFATEYILFPNEHILWQNNTRACKRIHVFLLQIETEALAPYQTAPSQNNGSEICIITTLLSLTHLRACFLGTYKISLDPHVSFVSTCVHTLVPFFCERTHSLHTVSTRMTCVCTVKKGRYLL